MKMNMWEAKLAPNGRVNLMRTLKIRLHSLDDEKKNIVQIDYCNGYADVSAMERYWDNKGREMYRRLGDPVLDVRADELIVPKFNRDVIPCISVWDAVQMALGDWLRNKFPSTLQRVPDDIFYEMVVVYLSMLRAKDGNGWGLYMVDFRKRTATFIYFKPGEEHKVIVRSAYEISPAIGYFETRF